MKKEIKYIFVSFISMFLFISLSGFLFDDEQEYITFDDLPQEAKGFVNDYFKNYEIVRITRRGLYSVIFKGGSSINFNSKGGWESVVGNRNTIPTDFIEKNILDVIKNKYPDANVMSIYKQSKGYTFRLNNGFEVTVDLNANITKTKKYS